MKFFIKIGFVFALVFCWSFAGFSQSDKDKVEALRVSFISEKLTLTGSESEKFWPVYNEYNDKIKAIRKNLRQSYRKKAEPYSDAEAEELYQLDLRSKQAEVDVHRQYGDKIKSIIGVKKCVRLKVAEEEFKLLVMKTIKDQKND